MRVPGPETVDLKRRKRVATIEQSQQRVATEHHSRQRNPRKNCPNAQTGHADSLSRPSFLLTDVCPSFDEHTSAIYDNRYCQKRLFCLPIIRNTREFPLTESWAGLACGVALNRTVLPTRPTILSRGYPHMSLEGFSERGDGFVTCGGRDDAQLVIT